MHWVAGLVGLHVALLVVPEQKPEFEISLLTNQTVALLAVGIALKVLNCPVGPVLLV